MQVTLDVDMEAAQQLAEVKPYCATHDAIVQAEHAVGPLADDWSGLLTYLQSSTVSPYGVFFRASSVIQTSENVDTHRSTHVSNVVKHKKLKPSTKKAEMSAFLLVNPYGDYHEPFNMDRYLQYKGNSASGGSASVNGTAWLEFSRWIGQNIATEECTQIIFFKNALHCSNNGYYERSQTSWTFILSFWESKKWSALWKRKNYSKLRWKTMRGSQGGGCACPTIAFTLRYIGNQSCCMFRP